MPEEKETGRLEAFSDGVFAIAITLLILEIRVPKPEEVGGHGLLKALTALWPSYLAFLISFATILVMWVNHHRIFALIWRSDHRFLYWNGLLLLVVTAVPFPTAVLAAYLMDPEAKVAAGVFAGTYFFIALAFNGLWRHASRNGRLLAHDAKAQEVNAITKQYRFGPVLYLVAFAASFLSVGLCVGLCLALAVFFAVRGESAETTSSRGS